MKINHVAEIIAQHLFQCPIGWYIAVGLKEIDNEVEIVYISEPITKSTLIKEDNKNIKVFYFAPCSKSGVCKDEEVCNQQCFIECTTESVKKQLESYFNE